MFESFFFAWAFWEIFEAVDWDIYMLLEVFLLGHLEAGSQCFRGSFFVPQGCQ